MKEAERALWNINGAWSVNHQLSANLVRHGSRENFWRKKYTSEWRLDNGEKEDGKGRRNEELQIQAMDEGRNCELELDTSKLKRVESCMVGKTKGCCDTSWLMASFREQRIFGIWPTRVSTDQFVIGFDDDETRRVWEEGEWDGLRHWFSKIYLWRPELEMENRLAEIQLIGLPLVFWKKENAEKIAALWGVLHTVEINFSSPDDARVCTFTVVISHLNRIDEIVEVGHENFISKLRACETGRVVQWVEESSIEKAPPMTVVDDRANSDVWRSSKTQSEEEEGSHDEVYRLRTREKEALKLEIDDVEACQNKLVHGENISSLGNGGLLKLAVDVNEEYDAGVEIDEAARVDIIKGDRAEEVGVSQKDNLDCEEGEAIGPVRDGLVNAGLSEIREVCCENQVESAEIDREENELNPSGSKPQNQRSNIRKK